MEENCLAYKEHKNNSDHHSPYPFPFAENHVTYVWPSYTFSPVQQTVSGIVATYFDSC
jgi:hypothetical protein